MKRLRQTAVAMLWALGWGASIAATVQVTVQDDKGQPLRDAVVFLESREAAQLVKPKAGVEVSQEGKAFLPAVQVVPRGTSVTFPNRDTVRHHVYSFSPAKKFELKLYAGTPASPVVFDQPGIVVLGCNIHDDMIAWVLVVDTPYSGTSAANGRVVFDDVPPGNYRLRVWHNRLPVGATPLDLAQTVSASGATVTVPLRGLAP